MSLLKWLKSLRKQSAVSVQESKTHRESVQDFEPRPEREIVNQERFPESTSKITVASLGKRPRSSDTSPPSDIVLKSHKKKVPW